MLAIVLQAIIAAVLAIMGAVLSLRPPDRRAHGTWVIAFGVLGALSVTVAAYQELGRRAEAHRLDDSLMDVKAAVQSANGGLDKVRLGIGLIQQGLADVQRVTQAPSIIVAESTTVRATVPASERPPQPALVPPSTPVTTAPASPPKSEPRLEDVVPSTPARPAAPGTGPQPPPAPDEILKRSNLDATIRERAVTAVRAALEQYAQAWSTMSVSKISEVYPHLTRRQDITNNFRDMTDYSMTIGECTLEIDAAPSPALATATCATHVSYNHKLQGHQDRTVRTRFRLLRKGERWEIDSVTDGA